MGSELIPVSVRIELIIGHLADVTKNCLTSEKADVRDVVSVCIKERDTGGVCSKTSVISEDQCLWIYIDICIKVCEFLKGFIYIFTTQDHSPSKGFG